MNRQVEISTTHSDENQGLWDRIKAFFARFRVKRVIRTALHTLKPEIDNRYTEAPERMNATEQTAALDDRIIAEMDSIFHGQNPGEYLMSLHGEDERETVRMREEALRQLAEALNQQYHIDNFQLVFQYSSSLINGAYNWKEKTLSVNSCYLAIDDISILNDAVDTILHEFRHAVQRYAVFSEEERLGFDYDTRRAWAQNFSAYISVQNDPKGYNEQPLEADARNYAAYIMATYMQQHKRVTT